MNLPRPFVAVAFLSFAAGQTLAGDPSSPQPLPYAQQEFKLGVESREDATAARERFRHAMAGYYNAMVHERRETPGLWRMRGNALLLAKFLPAAIMAYRQGLVLDPDDTELRRGLDLARSRVAYASPEDRATLTPRAERLDWLRHALRQWGLSLIVASSVLAWIALQCWVRTRRPRWFTSFVVALALALLASGGWLWERWERHQADAKPFAVLVRAEMLRRGDGTSFLPRRDTQLPPGVEVRQLGSRREWTQVELADGTVGWLPVSSLYAPDNPIH